MPNIDELWNNWWNYTAKEKELMTKENFTKAIAEVIIFPVVAPIMQPKVYVVEGYDSLTNSDEIKGVFSTKEKALKWMKEHNYSGEPPEYEVA